MSGPSSYKEHEMTSDLQALSDWSNRCRYLSGGQEGHYESYFLRANHPERPLAFWLRYTLLSPKNDLRHAMGAVWAVFFNGETGAHASAKEEFPLASCRFTPDIFQVKIGESVLDGEHLKGSAASSGSTVEWDLRYRSDQQPLLLLPRLCYEKWFPAAKSLVGMPLARFDGTLSVNGEALDIADWCGSQNHNWGGQHTSPYAWGQVAGFETHPESFLEVASAQVKIGPWGSPFLTPLVLRHNGREEAMNGMLTMLMAKSSYSYFVWSFASENGRVAVEGTISAPREAFVGLHYNDPPGGLKQCLNTKIASCELRIRDKAAGRNGKPEVLFTRHRAAFEILTDDREHGVAIRS
jgi:hypothetical protein